jgi:hypothetical protein
VNLVQAHQHEKSGRLGYGGYSQVLNSFDLRADEHPQANGIQHQLQAGASLCLVLQLRIRMS